jgi:hypothetical protein
MSENRDQVPGDARPVSPTRRIGVLPLREPVTKEAFDAEVARIAQEKLHAQGWDLVVHSMGDGVTRFLIKVQSTGREYDLIKSFFHRDNGR